MGEFVVVIMLLLFTMVVCVFTLASKIENLKIDIEIRDNRISSLKDANEVLKRGLDNFKQRDQEHKGGTAKYWFDHYERYRKDGDRLSHLLDFYERLAYAMAHKDVSNITIDRVPEDKDMVIVSLLVPCVEEDKISIRCEVDYARNMLDLMGFRLRKFHGINSWHYGLEPASKFRLYKTTE